jgi:hypothetical protein
MQNQKCFALQAACKESQKQYMPVKLEEVGIKPKFLEFCATATLSSRLS